MAAPSHSSATVFQIDPRDRDEAGRRGANPDTFAYVP